MHLHPPHPPYADRPLPPPAPGTIAVAPPQAVGSPFRTAEKYGVEEIIDPREESLPDIGLVRFEDAETGTSQWIDTGDPAVREAFQKNMHVRSRRNADLFARSGVDTVRLSTDRSYVQPLMQLFKKRGSK